MRPRLLERISHLAQGPVKSPPNRREALIESLTRHLSALLSAQPALALAPDNFGLTAPLALGGEPGPEGSRELERAVLEVIKKFEPRLREPALTCRPTTPDQANPAGLALTLTGAIDLEEPQSLSLTAYLATDGQIRVIH
jgi:type VI secretion system lysozyme-like protein